MKTKSKPLNIAGIALLAAVLLYAAVSPVAVALLFRDVFARTAPPAYSAHLYYKDVADRYDRKEVEFRSGKNRLRGHLYGEAKWTSKQGMLSMIRPNPLSSD